MLYWAGWLLSRLLLKLDHASSRTSILQPPLANSLCRIRHKHLKTGRLLDLSCEGCALSRLILQCTDGVSDAVIAPSICHFCTAFDGGGIQETVITTALEGNI